MKWNSPQFEIPGTIPLGIFLLEEQKLNLTEFNSFSGDGNNWSNFCSKITSAVLTKRQQMLELISAEPLLCAQLMDLKRKQSSVSRYGKRKGRGGVPSLGCEEMRNVWQVAGETCNADVNFNAAAVLTGAMGFVRAPRND